MKCPFVIKVCTKCKRILVANEINFRKDKRSKSGLQSKCKICGRQYYQDNKEKIKEKAKQYYQDNKEERKEYKKQYYNENKEEILEKCKQYREEHKEEKKEYNKEYYQDNKEEIANYQKQYRENNPEKIFNWHNKRRTSKESLGRGVTKEQWLEMMNFFDWKCAYSDEYIGGDSDKRTIDHIIPLNKGGLNEIWNCVPMLRDYNSSKKTNSILEWYQKQNFYSEERLLKIIDWITYSMVKWKYK